MKYMIRYIILFIFLLEIVGRFVGLTFPDMGKDLEKSKPSSYAGFHNLYGPYPLPGSYEVYFNDSWKHVTHNKDSNRITRPPNDTTDYSRKPGIAIYGCSFTWGSGLDDSSTYPYLVQTALPSYNVQNKGVFAAGNLVAYLQLREAIRRGNVPAIALVAYASFHDERNTFNREWATMIKESVKQDHSDGEKMAAEAAQHVDTMRFPQARLLQDTLNIAYKPLEGNLFPFSRYSVTCFLVNQLLNYLNERRIKSNEVTRSIFYGMNDMCRKHHVRLIITCIDDDENTSAMKKYFDRLGIEYLDFGVNYNSDNRYNQYPDLHPNERANAIYAARIIDYLKQHPLPKAGS